MKIFKESMFQPDGSIVQLFDILQKLERNKLMWSVLYFEGIGRAPNLLSMEEFEREIEIGELGFTMDWAELFAFSQGLEQTFDCVVVGYKRDQVFDKNRILNGEDEGCEVIIDAFDSEEWIVKDQGNDNILDVV
ncbi:hypothetical protein J4E05_16575 [Thalassospira sp. NFXS8]|uniref:hypothetical protein n=1 Tax=Thalassospira sp. NFXS8 TaxID=2819093 RepID=UPI0032DF11F0